MKKAIFTLFLALFLCSSFQAKNVIEYELQSILDQRSDELIDISIVFKSQLNSAKLMAKAERSERFVVKFSKKTQYPTENFVYISGDELIINAEGTVQIVDMMGRILYCNEINGNERINLGHLDKAAYIVRCVKGEEIKTQKIVFL